jgi:hypothetical protein
MVVFTTMFFITFDDNPGDFVMVPATVEMDVEVSWFGALQPAYIITRERAVREIMPRTIVTYRAR